MWNEPTIKQLSALPDLDHGDCTPVKEKMISMHFFLGGCDWYIAEYCANDQLFFGYAILHNDYENAEWGYISLQQLKEFTMGPIHVDRDLHFTPKRAVEIEKICKGHGWAYGKKEFEPGDIGSGVYTVGDAPGDRRGKR